MSDGLPDDIDFKQNGINHIKIPSILINLMCLFTR